MKDYIHPNLKPKNKQTYLDVVIKYRDKSMSMTKGVIYITKNEYDILEQASQNKGVGHQINGVPLEIG